MKRRLARLSPHQTAKVVAITLAAFSLLVLVPITVVSTLPFEDPTYLLAIVVLPVVHLIFGYLGVALLCVFYNAVAERLGGIEYVVEDVA